MNGKNSIFFAFPECRAQKKGDNLTCRPFRLSQRGDQFSKALPFNVV